MATIPSIAMIPSGYKASKVYSVLPTDGAGDLTFSRAGALPSFNATRVNSEGLIEQVLSNVPRLDYSDGGCPSLLVEPQRTNLLTYSNNFVLGWENSTLTINENFTTSPDGTLNASKVEINSSGGSLRNFSQITLVNNYTFSIFVKKGNSRYVTLRSAFFTTNIVVGFDLDTLTAGTDGKIEAFDDGWYRLSISKNISSDADKTGLFYIYLPNSFGTFNSVIGNYNYFYGGQVEDGSNASSYIPTVASTVTRVAETVSKTGLSSYINSQEGVFFVEISSKETSNLRYLTLSDGSTSNEIILGFISPTTVFTRLTANSTAYTISSSIISTEQSIKIAIKYSPSTYSLFINGVEINEIPSTSPENLSQITFSRASGSQPFYGKVKNLQVYPTALSDAQLIALTTL
jgi:hypothetical protein